MSTFIWSWAAQGQPIDLDVITGVYKQRFENSYSGQVYEDENVLEIVRLTPETAYFRLALRFVNAHRCNLWGVAHVTGNRLVYRPPDQLECEMSINRNRDALVLSDKAACRPGCSPRGHYTGAEFELAKRRPILYMARLRASTQFNEALAEDIGRAGK